MSDPVLQFVPPPEKRRTPLDAWNARLVLSVRWALNSGSFLLADYLALVGSFLAAGWIRYLYKGGTMLPEWTAWIVLLWTILSFGFRLTPGWGLNAVEELKKVTLLLTTIFAGVTSILFLAKLTDNTSRLTLGLAFFFSLFLVPLLRKIIKALLVRSNLWGMQVVVYGSREKVEHLISILQEAVGIGYIPAGAYVLDSAPPSIRGVPTFPWNSEPYPFAEAALLLEPKTLETHSPRLVESVMHQYRRVLLVPELEHNAPSLWITTRDLGGLVGMEVSSNLLDPLARSLKITFDFFTVLLTAPFMLPALGIITVMIWLQDFRSPLFVQERIGRNGKVFPMWKFRTMHHNAETILQERLKKDEAFRQEWEQGCKVQRDPRITLFGRFLRRTSLDELPQILNVLKGEMSLIGPRPLPSYHNEQLPTEVLELRQRVRPGMTGLWQVSGRSESGNEGIARWDAYYVRNWSIWLDIVILARTVRAVLWGKGAY